MKEIRLTLTLEEINKILEGWGQMPFVQVYQLVGKIQQQVALELQEEPKETENENPKQ